MATRTRHRTVTLPGATGVPRRAVAAIRERLERPIAEARAQLDPAVAWQLIQVEAGFGWLGVLGVPRSWHMAKVHGRPRQPIAVNDPAGGVCTVAEVIAAVVPTDFDVRLIFMPVPKNSEPHARAGADVADVGVIDYLSLLAPEPTPQMVCLAVWPYERGAELAPVYRRLRSQGLHVLAATDAAYAVATAPA